MEWDYNSFDASIWLCSPPTFKSKKEPHHTDLKRLLEAGKSNMECDTAEDVSPASPLVEYHNIVPKSELKGNETTSHDNIVVSWYKKQLLKFRNLQVKNCGRFTSNSNVTLVCAKNYNYFTGNNLRKIRSEPFSKAV